MFDPTSPQRESAKNSLKDYAVVAAPLGVCVFCPTVS